MILYVCEASEDRRQVGNSCRKTAFSPRLHIETEHERQLTAIRLNRNINKSWRQEKNNKWRIYALRTSAIEQNSSSQGGKIEDRKEEVTEVSMKLCLVFVCQDVILWSSAMKDIN